MWTLNHALRLEWRWWAVDLEIRMKMGGGEQFFESGFIIGARMTGTQTGRVSADKWFLHSDLKERHQLIYMKSRRESSSGDWECDCVSKISPQLHTEGYYSKVAEQKPLRTKMIAPLKVYWGWSPRRCGVSREGDITSWGEGGGLLWHYYIIQADSNYCIFQRAFVSHPKHAGNVCTGDLVRYRL